MLKRIVSVLLLSSSFISVHALEPASVNVLGLASLGITPIDASNSKTTPLNIQIIKMQTGLRGLYNQANNEYKIAVPRDDLQVIVNGMKMTPEMGLTSFVTFKKINDQAVVTGDLILLQDQVNPVMTVALANNLEVTDLHSPFLWDSPRVMLMHVKAEGNEKNIAKSIGKVFAEINRTSNGNGDFPYANFDELQTTLHPQKINMILGEKAAFKNGSYNYVFSQDKKEVNASAIFSGADNNAVVEGSITLHQPELQKTLVSLRKAQFFVIAIYEHVINGEANYIVHYWGIGNSQALAKTLHSTFAVAQQNSLPNVFPIGAAMIFPIMQTVNCDSKKWNNEIASDLSESHSKPNVSEKTIPSQNLAQANQGKASQPSIKSSSAKNPVKHKNYFTLWLENSTRMLNSARNTITNLSASFHANVIHNPIKSAPKELPVAQKQVIEINTNQDKLSSALLSTPKTANTEVTEQASDFTNKQKLSMHVSKFFGAKHEEIVMGNPGDLLTHLIAAQNKNYDYIAQMIKVSPVAFLPEPIHQNTQAMNVVSHNDHVISPATKMLTKRIASAMRIDNSNAVRQLVNAFPLQAIVAQNKEFHYMNSPVHQSMDGLYTRHTLHKYKVAMFNSAKSQTLHKNIRHSMHASHKSDMSPEVLHSKYVNLNKMPLYVPHNTLHVKSVVVAHHESHYETPVESRVYPFDGVAE